MNPHCRRCEAAKLQRLNLSAGVDPEELSVTTPVADAEPAIAVPAAADPPPALVLALPDLAAVPPSGTSTPRSALTDAFSLCCQSSTDMAAEAAAVAASLAAALAKVGARVGLRWVGGWVARTHRHSCTQCARALFDLCSNAALVQLRVRDLIWHVRCQTYLLPLLQEHEAALVAMGLNGDAS